MYICPEATLLNVADNGTLMQKMLLLCTQMQNAISIFDIIGGKSPDSIHYLRDIKTFRNSTGNNGLNYGTAYYPFIGTAIVQNDDIDYTILFNGDVSQLAPIVNPSDNPNPALAALLANIQNPSSRLTIIQNNNALLNASRDYGVIIKKVLNDANLLPASGGMAGVLTTADNQWDVWRAPDNASIATAVSFPINLSGDQQAFLIVDPLTGKSINAIRSFKGVGIVVWGARTLGGNSQDWRYLSVRQTLIFIEQS